MNLITLNDDWMVNPEGISAIEQVGIKRVCIYLIGGIYFTVELSKEEILQKIKKNKKSKDTRNFIEKGV